MKTKMFFLAGIAALCAPILAANALPAAPSKSIDARAAGSTLRLLAGWDSGGGTSCAGLAQAHCEKYGVNSPAYIKCYQAYIKYQC